MLERIHSLLSTLKENKTSLQQLKNGAPLLYQQFGELIQTLAELIEHIKQTHSDQLLEDMSLSPLLQVNNLQELNADEPIHEHIHPEHDPEIDPIYDLPKDSYNHHENYIEHEGKRYIVLHDHSERYNKISSLLRSVLKLQPDNNFIDT